MGGEHGLQLDVWDQAIKQTSENYRKIRHAEISNGVENDFVRKEHAIAFDRLRVRQVLSQSIEDAMKKIEHAYDNYNFAVNSEINAFDVFEQCLDVLKRLLIFKSSVGSESTRRTNGCPRVNYELISRVSTNFTTHGRGSVFSSRRRGGRTPVFLQGWEQRK